MRSGLDIAWLPVDARRGPRRGRRAPARRRAGARGSREGDRVSERRRPAVRGSQLDANLRVAACDASLWAAGCACACHLTVWWSAASREMRVEGRRRRHGSPIAINKMHVVVVSFQKEASIHRPQFQSARPPLSTTPYRRGGARAGAGRLSRLLQVATARAKARITSNTASPPTHSTCTSPPRPGAPALKPHLPRICSM